MLNHSSIFDNGTGDAFAKLQAEARFAKVNSPKAETTGTDDQKLGMVFATGGVGVATRRACACSAVAIITRAVTFATGGVGGRAGDARVAGGSAGHEVRRALGWAERAGSGLAFSLSSAFCG